MKKITFSFCFLALSAISLFSQTTEPFSVEAESGVLGSDYTTGTDGGITYIYPQTNFIATSNPGDASKVVSYSITFPEADTYDLYVKLYIGDGGNNDDSFYTPRYLGTNDPANGQDWVIINQLNETGYTSGSSVVDGALVQPEIINQWKWLNVSQIWNTSEWSYVISPGSLKVTFEIGAREDGLSIDKLVFGKTGVNYTVDELEGAKPLSTNKYESLETVTVSPNPSKGVFNIQSAEQSVSYKIYSILGAKVEEGTFGFGVNNCGENLKSGTYILDMQTKDKRSVSKIIKL